MGDILVLAADCFADVVKNPIMACAANISLSGTSNVTFGAQTFMGTLSGGGDLPGWNRSHNQSDVFNITTGGTGGVASDVLVVRAKCCADSACAQVIVAAGPDFERFILPDAALVDCTCTGTPCTGFPTSNTFDIVAAVEIKLITPCDPDNPTYQINADVTAAVDCGFDGTLTNWSAIAGPISAADLIGSHLVTVTNTDAAGTTTADITVTIS